MGQGCEVLRREARMSNAKYSVTPVRRIAGARLCGRLDRNDEAVLLQRKHFAAFAPCNFLAVIGPTTDITELYPVVAR